MTSRKFVGFDLEIAKEIGEDSWESYRPLGITCAALYRGSARAWLHEGLYPEREAMKASQMPVEDCRLLVQDLQSWVAMGHTITTWNGLGFDFDVLAEESGMVEECSELALGHVDMMFQAYCILGYPIGLNTVAKAMGLAGKTEGVSGAQAPAMWREGRRQEVLDYCAQDAKTTYEVAMEGDQRQWISWTSKRNLEQRLSLPNGWLTVRECLELPLPHTSWMDKPIPRDRFTSWLGKGL